MDFSEHKVIGIGVVVPEERRPFCVECRTTATPMWRGGPTGPRSLCNACGIRYRKKRRQELGLYNKQQPKQQAQQQQQQQMGQPQLQPPQQQQQQGDQHLQRDLSEAKGAVKDSNSSTSTKSSSLQVVKKRRVLMGVEEAAILLMALSSSSRSPAMLHG